MKSDARRLDQVIGGLDRIRVACLYGDDTQTIRDSARRLVAAASGSADDPFRVRECDGDQREAIESALASPGLSGGRATVWVRQASERLMPVATRALSGAAGALLVLEYAASTGRSRLRTEIESHAAGCVIACYVQAEATRDAIRTVLRAWNVTADNDAVALLAARADARQCPGGQAGLEAALYAGRDGALHMPAAMELAGAAASGGLDPGLSARLNLGLAGDSAALDDGITAVLTDGGGIGLLRGALSQLQRLRAMAVQMADGRSVAEAGRTLRPPLFFREAASVGAALRLWQPEQLEAAARAIWQAERASKAAGVPQDTVGRDTLAGLARIAAARVRPGGVRRG